MFRGEIKGGIGSVVAMTVLLIMFAAIAILNFEVEPTSNIRTAGDALWWSVTTMTTVGYGDKYPVTTEGRFVAGILMIGGIGLVGLFTACLASIFIRQNQQPAPELAALADEVRLLRKEVTALHQRIPAGRLPIEADAEIQQTH